jgi:nucleoside 2-deoxyribosyltransferase
MVVTVCGSRKNDMLMRRIADDCKGPYELLVPNLSISDFGIDAIRGVLHAKHQRILKSDVVVIITKDMGSSTIMELGIAYSLGKHIIALGDSDNDIERYACYDRVLPFPNTSNYYTIGEGIEALDNLLTKLTKYGLDYKENQEG